VNVSTYFHSTPPAAGTGVESKAHASQLLLDRDDVGLAVTLARVG
jgi:hypothetical protein